MNFFFIPVVWHWSYDNLPVTTCHHFFYVVSGARWTTCHLSKNDPLSKVFVLSKKPLALLLINSYFPFDHQLLHRGNSVKFSLYNTFEDFSQCAHAPTNNGCDLPQQKRRIFREDVFHLFNYYRSSLGLRSKMLWCKNPCFFNFSQTLMKY